MQCQPLRRCLAVIAWLTFSSSRQVTNPWSQNIPKGSMLTSFGTLSANICLMFLCIDVSACWYAGRCWKQPVLHSRWAFMVSFLRSAIQPVNRSTWPTPTVPMLRERRSRTCTSHQQEIQQTSMVATFSCSPFTIHVRHLLPTSNIDILVYYLLKLLAEQQVWEMWIHFCCLTLPLGRGRRALKLQVLENANIEKWSTKWQNVYGWKIQVRKIQVRVSRVGKCKYRKIEYGITIRFR